MIINTYFSADMGYGNDESRSMSPTPSPVLKNSPSTCPTLMLWANHLKETNKIDAGIMPPPATTLPLNIRRTSLGGFVSCGSADQSSPPLLKSEIMDENSQNSILSTGGDSMNHDSMDYVNDNSMDASNSATMMNTSPMSMMANSFQAPQTMMNISTSPITGIDLRVKQEDEMAVQMQDLVHPAMADAPKLMTGVHPADATFMASFDRPKLGDLKVQVNDVPMFSTLSAPSNADVILNNNLSAISHDVAPQLTNEQHMQQTMEQQNTVFGQQGLMTEAGTASGLNHMLSYPSATQSMPQNIMATSPTNQSPLSTDVMLNSQPISAINASPTMLTVDTVNNPSIESDIIMNSTISPTMMCNNTAGDANNLITNSGTIGDSPMLAAPTQPTSEALLNNFIQPMSMKQSAVVKNMILNAAAEILSSEPNSITAETTTNALMSLNTEQQPQPTPQHGSSPSITNILTHSDSTSSVVVLAGNNKLIQNGKFNSDFIQHFPATSFNNWNIFSVVAAAAAQNASDIIQNQVVNADSMQMSPFQTINPQILNVQPTTTAASAAAANLSPVQQNILSNIQ